MAHPAGHVVIASERCKGCGLCVAFCPAAVLIIDKKHLNTKGYHPAVAENPLVCMGCADCALMCPDSAITVYRQQIPRGASWAES